MAVRYRTKGFILKKEEQREADRIFTVYTEDFGKIKILGKAIRKIKSKLRGGIRVFCFSEIEFIQGKVYNTLTDAVIIKNFSAEGGPVSGERNAKNDLEKLKIAYKVSEALDGLINGEEPDERIWQLLNEVFDNLDIIGLKEIQNSPQGCNLLDSVKSGRKLSVKGGKILYHYFLWNLISILGYRIDLYECAVCRKKLDSKKNYFGPEEGIICQSCLSVKYPALSPYFQQEKSGMRAGVISSEVIKILRLFLKRDWQTISKLKITEDYENLLSSISENYLNYLGNSA